MDEGEYGMIKLYTGTNCLACKALKKRLVKLKLTNYIECDTAEEEHRDTIMALGFRSIPVLTRYEYDNYVDSIGGNVHSDAAYVEFFKE